MTELIKKKIDNLIKEVAKGNPILITTTKTKLILKGVDPDNYNESSEDDSNIITKINEIAEGFKVKI
jgi:hypothetical protein